METDNGEIAMEERRQLNHNAATLKNPSTPLSTKAVHSHLVLKDPKGLCSPNLVSLPNPVSLHLSLRPKMTLA